MEGLADEKIDPRQGDVDQGGFEEPVLVGGGKEEYSGAEGARLLG
jgi:hypothetical protein